MDLFITKREADKMKNILVSPATRRRQLNTPSFIPRKETNLGRRQNNFARENICCSAPANSSAASIELVPFLG